MLTKIGNDWVDLAEIVAARYFPENSDGDGPEHYAVTLRCGECIWLYDCSPAELEAALVRAGAAEGGEDTNVLTIPEEELPKLLELVNAGFSFLARDGDGKVYAYRNLPRRDGAYWDPATADDGEVVPLGREAFPFVEETEPFDIAKVVGGHAEV